MSDFTDLIDVVAERLGGAVLVANDEFFAAKENLIKAAAPQWRDDVYTERGKWMDGWETRRRREPGHDWCIVRLGVPAKIRGVVVDTSWFRGNYPESCSIDVSSLSGFPDLRALSDDTRTPWTAALQRSPLAGDTRNVFAVPGAPRATHLRLNIFPDGGVARLRVHGDVIPDPGAVAAGREVNLAAMELGAYVVACSDMFFGHRQNLILPGRSTHMGDGWETQRRRGPGHDWSIVRLAVRGSLERVEIDTDHYKGNAPASCTLEASDSPAALPPALADPAHPWRPVLQQSALQPHTRHVFAVDAEPATHVRLNIFPDGGIARLRVFGRPVA
ncbi:MAG: allantoicase [Gemmatimonadaceae bacterium]